MTTETEVRTRVGPSPTGDPHIGTAYMVLFDTCLAKKHGGKFILRIEDTDQSRSTPESEAKIFESLRWLGLEWDEGPDIGGPYGPYRQSERTEIYRDHCAQLLDGGHTYRCFCTPKELDAMRDQQSGGSTGYDGRCARLSGAEVKSRLDAGTPFAVRMKTPDEGDCVVEDMLRGQVAMPWSNVDDQVLMKSDNFPTYHLANVVDDHLMRISHVVRGEEWINSTPKHLLLYEYFGWEPPKFCHLPLLRNPDKSKLSKRKNPTSILYYRQAGILPEALRNYLGLMGYTLPNGEEMFSLDEMIESFDITRVSLGGPIFDIEKLTWLNARYIREKHDPASLLARLKDWGLNDEAWLRILPLAQERIQTLADLVPLVAFLFADSVDYAAEDLIPKRMEGDETARLLRIAVWELEKIRAWDAEALQDCLQNVAGKEDVPLRDLVRPFYVALTGSTSSTPLFETMVLLGSDMTRRRLARALDALAEAGFVLSKKKQKVLEKEYGKMFR